MVEQKLSTSRIIQDMKIRHRNYASSAIKRLRIHLIHPLIKDVIITKVSGSSVEIATGKSSRKKSMVPGQTRK